MTTDPNPVTIDSSNPEQSLANVARDGAQGTLAKRNAQLPALFLKLTNKPFSLLALINQLMTTCPITANAEGVLLSLPPVSTPIPREKPIPKPKEPTKWERFAAKRGIKPKTREQRRNLAYDEETGEWRPKWGYKGLNKKGEDDWLVEVDPEADARRKEGTSVRMDGRRERKERIKRNERRMRKNLLQSQKGKKKA